MIAPLCTAIRQGICGTRSRSSPYADDSMDENEVRSLVNGWHARAQQEDEHITRFVFLWFPLQNSINSLEDFPGIVWCVYQVRCNLFHGAKRAGDTRDYELIRNMCQNLGRVGWLPG